MASVKQYEPGIDECIDVLHDRLAEHVICGDEINVSHTVSSFVWDVFSIITVRTLQAFKTLVLWTTLRML